MEQELDLDAFDAFGNDEDEEIQHNEVHVIHQNEVHERTVDIQ